MNKWLLSLLSKERITSTKKVKPSNRRTPATKSLTECFKTHRVTGLVRLKYSLKRTDVRTTSLTVSTWLDYCKSTGTS